MNHTIYHQFHIVGAIIIAFFLFFFLYLLLRKLLSKKKSLGIYLLYVFLIFSLVFVIYWAVVQEHTFDSLENVFLFLFISVILFCIGIFNKTALSSSPIKNLSPIHRKVFFVGITITFITWLSSDLINYYRQEKYEVIYRLVGALVVFTLYIQIKQRLKKKTDKVDDDKKTNELKEN